MAQLGHKNHLCAWSCAGFGNKDKHDQTARTRLRKLHRFNMFDRKLWICIRLCCMEKNGSGAHAILMRVAPCTAQLLQSVPLIFTCTCCVGYALVCFFFHFYLTLGFLFNLCLCDFDLPASKDGATDNFLFQRCNQPEAFQYFQLHGKWCWQTAPQSWNLEPY